MKLDVEIGEFKLDGQVVAVIRDEEGRCYVVLKKDGTVERIPFGE